MATQYVFPGSVSADGKPTVDNLPRYRETLRSLAGQRIEFVIRKPKSKRSLDLNAYWHASDGPFRRFADHFGEDIPGIKLALLGHCFGWAYSQVAGREIPIKGHTSELSAEDGKYFTDWMLIWGPRDHGVQIDPPGTIE